MRRKLLCAGFIAASFVTVFGCGQKPGDTENTIYTAADIINCLGYDPDDYVEAGDYRNIKVSLDEEDYTVTEQDIRERIDAESAQMPVYTKTTKKTVKDGDTVRIDYSGIPEGEEEPSWEGSGEHLTIGSGQMPDGFENGLIGHSVGDTVKLDLVCPEDHPDQGTLPGRRSPLRWRSKPLRRWKQSRQRR
ncbi:MAG: FKBP-type peptidyl-prolyl cis-trans isomerase [Eubacterium sp.]